MCSSKSRFIAISPPAAFQNCMTSLHIGPATARSRFSISPLTGKTLATLVPESGSSETRPRGTTTKISWKCGRPSDALDFLVPSFAMRRIRNVPLLGTDLWGWQVALQPSKQGCWQILYIIPFFPAQRSTVWIPCLRLPSAIGHLCASPSGEFNPSFNTFIT